MLALLSVSVICSVAGSDFRALQDFFCWSGVWEIKVKWSKSQLKCILKCSKNITNNSHIFCLFPHEFKIWIWVEKGSTAEAKLMRMPKCGWLKAELFWQSWLMHFDIFSYSFWFWSLILEICCFHLPFISCAKEKRTFCLGNFSF